MTLTCQNEQTAVKSCFLKRDIGNEYYIELNKQLSYGRETV